MASRLDRGALLPNAACGVPGVDVAQQLMQYLVCDLRCSTVASASLSRFDRRQHLQQAREVHSHGLPRTSTLMSK